MKEVLSTALPLLLIPARAQSWLGPESASNAASVVPAPSETSETTTAVAGGDVPYLRNDTFDYPTIIQHRHSR